MSTASRARISSWSCRWGSLANRTDGRLGLQYTRGRAQWQPREGSESPVAEPKFGPEKRRTRHDATPMSGGEEPTTHFYLEHFTGSTPPCLAQGTAAKVRPHIGCRYSGADDTSCPACTPERCRLPIFGEQEENRGESRPRLPAAAADLRSRAICRLGPEEAEAYSSSSQAAPNKCANLKPLKAEDRITSVMR